MSFVSITSHTTRGTVPYEFLRRAFPFYLLVSHELDFLHVGPALQRALPALLPGTSFGCEFDLLRPGTPLTAAALRALEGDALVLRHRSGLKLQGEVFETEPGFIFMCVPMVTELRELSELGLRLDDFPAHDVTADYLLLLQSTQLNMRALEAAATEIGTQHHDLKTSKLALEATLVTMQAAQTALAKTEQIYRTVVDTVRETIFRIDSLGRFTFLNNAWALSTDSPVEQWIGLTIFDAIHPSHHHFVREALTAADAGPLEVQLSEAAGFRWVQLIFSPANAEPDAFGRIGGMHDVTLQHNARLMLEEGILQLQEANQIAERNSQAKTDWLAAMSHEVRTPLHAISGMAELLLETPLNAAQQEYLEAVTSNARHMGQLLSNLLDLEKITQGDFDLQSITFEPRQILTELAQLARVNLAFPNVQVRTTIDPSVPFQLLADASRIRQICFNLASNAAKFTKQGQVEIGIRGAGRADGGYTLHIEVADTGIGISADDQRRIFERHFRAQNVASMRGTGLGLHIAHAIAETMRGSLTFVSREGQGTCFSLVIPCDLPHHALGESPDGMAPSTPTAPAPRHQACILVVEDYLPSQTMAKIALVSHGHTVDVASSGAEAVALASKNRYDLILMDLQLPDFSGIEAGRQIRLCETRLHEAPVPIVAVTAHALVEHRDQCRVAGMNDFATKPLSPQALRALVTRWCDARTPVLIGNDSGHGRGGPGQEPGDGPAAVAIPPELADLVPGYLEGILQDLAACTDGAGVTDFNRVRTVGHNVKGTGTTFGFPDLSAIARDVEAAAAAGHHAAAAAGLCTLRDKVGQAQLAIRSRPQ